MHTEKTVLCSVESGIGRLTFNRPEQANSMGLMCRADLIEAVDRLAEPDVRVLVITGRGSYFNTGGDINEFQQHQASLEQLIEQNLRYAHPYIHRLASLPIPVISAVNGPVGGAGIGFALCADFVLATDTAKLRGGYCGIGLSPDTGASYFLTRRIGASKAKQIFMRNRAWSAQECLHLGIFDQLFPSADFADAVESLARELASGPTASYGHVKSLCEQAFGRDLQTHLDSEQALLLQSARSRDCREGIASFIEKRPPVFTGS